MKIRLITTTPILFLCLLSCKDHKQNQKEKIEVKTQTDQNIADSEKIEKHWSYEGETGPEHWAEIEKDSDCQGSDQSPINIIDKDVNYASDLKPLEIHYAPSTKIHDVINNGHSIQYNFEQGDYITYDGVKYDLKQIHFHEASEHTINGVRYPMEMHMVHTNAKNEYAVLAVMAEEGEGSEPFNFLEKYLPLNQGEEKTVDASFDLNLNFPSNKKYYYYKGSLTTPPCTEGVNWFVYKTPITISLEQVKALQKLMPLNNYRTERPLNNRVVQTNSK